MSNDSIALLDAAGRPTVAGDQAGYLAGRTPRNKGMQYPPDAPRPEEIILVMRVAGNDRHGPRIRALIAVRGVVGCGSPKRWRSTRPTSTRVAARC